METPNYFVGVDQSKNYFDAVVKNRDGKILRRCRFNTNYRDFKKFEELLFSLSENSLHQDFILGIESTGSYHKTFLKFFLKKGFVVLELNPLHVSNFSKGNTFRKTINDQISAANIADFLIQHYTQFINYKSISDEHLELRELTRLLTSRNKQITALKTWIKGQLYRIFPEIFTVVKNVLSKTILQLLSQFPSPKHIISLSFEEFSAQVRQIQSGRGKKININVFKIYRLAEKSISDSSKSLDSVLQDQIILLLHLLEQKKNLLKHIREFVETHENIASQVGIITSIPGIDVPSAATFIAEVGDINRFKNRNSITAFAGLDPTTKVSGDSVNKTGHISRMGSHTLRKIMYTIALCVARHDVAFNAWKERKKQAGSSGKKATVSLANKLIKIIFALLKKQTNYDINISIKNLNITLNPKQIKEVKKCSIA